MKSIVNPVSPLSKKKKQTGNWDCQTEIMLKWIKTIT